MRHSSTAARITMIGFYCHAITTQSFYSKRTKMLNNSHSLVDFRAFERRTG